MLAFAKSVLVGTLVGAAPILLLTVPLGVGLAVSPLSDAVDFWLSLLTAVTPLIVSFGFVLLSTVLLGLPTFWALAKFKQTAPPVYALWGGFWGLVVAAGFCAWIGRPIAGWEPVLGAASGAATWASGRRAAKARPSGGRAALSEAEREQIQRITGRAAKRSFLWRINRTL